MKEPEVGENEPGSVEPGSKSPGSNREHGREWRSLKVGQMNQVPLNQDQNP
ncbi:hypothetical protein [Evansella tamaricis]|uniref:Uncharacterized protein n=1 Tax=Evansella tamaricis TaxID=2069301 RepID=A0ABS6JIP4_9BACI|nr:hypothetical protein [Evansella tamaricis]MBU9713551.1 hypothetical protein [Evansella tamaricis]